MQLESRDQALTFVSLLLPWMEMAVVGHRALEKREEASAPKGFGKDSGVGCRDPRVLFADDRRWGRGRGAMHESSGQYTAAPGGPTPACPKATEQV